MCIYIYTHVYTHKPNTWSKEVLHHPWDSQFLYLRNPPLYSLHAKLDLKPFEMQGRKALLRGISGRGTVVGGIFGGWKLNFGWVGFPKNRYRNI